MNLSSSLSILAAMALLVAPLHAQEGQPTLDDLLNVAPDPAAPEVEQPEATVDDPAPERINPNVERLLDADDAANRFEQAIAEMADVASRLGPDAAEASGDAGLDTQRMQEAILKKLDAVIEAAKQQQQQQQQSSSSSSSSSSSGEPGEPKQGDQGSQGNQSQGDPKQGQSDPKNGGQQPGDQKGSQQQKGDGDQDAKTATRGERGEGAAGDPQHITETRQEWGNLPPRLRGELSDGFQEPYSPVYRSLTESYYRKLAEMGEE